MFALKRSSLNLIESIIESKNDDAHDAVIAYARARGDGRDPVATGGVKSSTDKMLRLLSGAFRSVSGKFRDQMRQGFIVNVEEPGDVPAFFLDKKMDGVLKSWINKNHPDAKKMGGDWLGWANLDWTKLPPVKLGELEGAVNTALTNAFFDAIKKRKREIEHETGIPGKRDPGVLGVIKGKGGRSIVDKASQRKEEKAIRSAVEKALKSFEGGSPEETKFIEYYVGAVRRGDKLALSGLLVPKKGGGRPLHGFLNDALRHAGLYHRKAEKLVVLLRKRIFTNLQRDPIGKHIFPAGYKLEDQNMIRSFLLSFHGLTESIVNMIKEDDLDALFLITLLRV